MFVYIYIVMRIILYLYIVLYKDIWFIYMYSVLCLYLFIYGTCMHIDIGLFIYGVRYFIIYVNIYTNIYNIYKKKEIY